jgi:hypothetical protein
MNLSPIASSFNCHNIEENLLQKNCLKLKNREEKEKIFPNINSF